MTPGTLCPVCGQPLPGRDRAKGGRALRYCSGACKAKAYRTRQQAGEPAGTGRRPLPAPAARYARAIEIRRQIGELAGVLADTASGQQALFGSPDPRRRTTIAAPARALHQLITELTALATAAAVTKHPTIRPGPATALQTAPLFDEPGTDRK